MQEPKVYKILESGELHLLGEMDSLNKYTVSENDNGNIIVIYSIKLPEEKEGRYTNTIKVAKVTKDAKINSGKESLPDLF